MIVIKLQGVISLSVVRILPSRGGTELCTIMLYFGKRMIVIQGLTPFISYFLESVSLRPDFHRPPVLLVLDCMKNKPQSKKVTRTEAFLLAAQLQVTC